MLYGFLKVLGKAGYERRSCLPECVFPNFFNYHTKSGMHFRTVGPYLLTFFGTLNVEIFGYHITLELSGVCRGCGRWMI